MPKKIRVKSNYFNPNERREDVLNIHTMAANFEESWNRSVDEDYALLTQNMASTELSSVLQAFNLPADTSKDTLVGLARRYCLSQNTDNVNDINISLEDVTRNSDIRDEAVKARKLTLMNDFRTRLLDSEQRKDTLRTLLSNFNHIEVTMPDIENITVESLDNGTRKARLNLQYNGFVELGNKLNPPITVFEGRFEGDSLYTDLERSNFISDSKTIIKGNAALHNSLINLFKQERYSENPSPQNVNINTKSNELKDTMNGLSKLLLDDRTPTGTFTLNVGDDNSDISTSIVLPNSPNSGVMRLIGISEGVQALVEGYTPFMDNAENDFRNNSPKELLEYVRGEYVETDLIDRPREIERTMDRLLSIIENYVNEDTAARFRFYDKPVTELTEEERNTKGKPASEIWADRYAQEMGKGADILSRITYDGRALSEYEPDALTRILTDRKNIRTSDNYSEDEITENINDIDNYIHYFYSHSAILGLDSVSLQSELLRQDFENIVYEADQDNEVLARIKIGGKALSEMTAEEAETALDKDRDILSQISINDKPLSEMDIDEAYEGLDPSKKNSSLRRVVRSLYRNAENINGLNTALSDIYINGISLKGMDIDDAANAIKESLYADSESILEVRDTNSKKIIPFIPDGVVSRKKDFTFSAVFEADELAKQKRERTEEFRIHINSILGTPTEENIKSKGIIQAPVSDNLSSAQYLEAITGKKVDINDPGSIRNAVQNIYIDGKNIVDTLKLDMTSGNLDRYVQTIKNALDPKPDNKHFVTLMNRCSVSPDPKPIIPARSAADPAMRNYVVRSVFFAKNYQYSMSEAAKDAQAYEKALRRRNKELFLANKNVDHYEAYENSQLFNATSGFDITIMPSLYMMSKGYTMEQAFGNDKKYDDVKKRLGKEFFDKIERPRDENGELFPINSEEFKQRYKDVFTPLMEDMAKVLGSIKSEYIDINVKENLPRLAFMNRIYQAGDIFNQIDTHSIDQNELNATRGIAASCKLFSDIAKNQLKAIAQNVTPPADIIREAIFQSNGDPAALYGAPLGTYSAKDSLAYYKKVLSSENIQRAIRTQQQAAQLGMKFNINLNSYDNSLPKEPLTQEQIQAYLKGDKKDVLNYIKALGGEEFANSYRKTASDSANLPENAEEYKKHIEKCVYQNSPSNFTTDNGHFNKENWDVICRDGVNDNNVMDEDKKYPLLLTSISGIYLDKNSSAEKIDIALSKIYINDRPLKELLNFKAEDCVGNDGYNKLMTVNTMLKNIANEAFQSDKTAILTREVNGKFTPFVLDYFVGSQDLSPDELEEKNKGQESVRKGIDFAETYARMLNNENIPTEEMNSLYKKNALPLSVISSADLENSQQDIFKRLLGRDISNNVDDLKAAADNFYINDKSFYEYFNLDRNTVTAEQIRGKEVELTKIMKDEFRHYVKNEGNEAKFLLMKDAATGAFRPVTFFEPIPELKPEVEPMGFWDRLWASDEKIAAYNNNVKEQQVSQENYLSANSKNLNARERNQAALAYAKALNKDILSDEDKKILSDKKINSPNADFYGRKNLPAAPVRPISLANAQQMSNNVNTNAQNRNFTQFTNTNNQNTPNNPQTENSMQ